MTPDKIQLNDLDIACVIGVNAEERVATQNVYVSAELDVDTRAAAKAEHLAYTVDYEFVAATIRFLLQAGQFLLLETACHALCHALLLPPLAGATQPAIERVRLRVCKPQGLTGNAYPSLELVRTRADVVFDLQQRPFGSDEVVFESTHVGIHRTIITPGKETSPGVPQSGGSMAMLLTDGLEIDGSRLTRGAIGPSPQFAFESCRNSTELDQALLLVRRPLVRNGSIALNSAV